MERFRSSDLVKNIWSNDPSASKSSPLNDSGNVSKTQPKDTTPGINQSSVNQSSRNSSTSGGRQLVARDHPDHEVIASASPQGDKSPQEDTSDAQPQKYDTLRWQGPDDLFVRYVSGLLADSRAAATASGQLVGGEPRALVVLPGGILLIAGASGQVLVANPVARQLRAVARVDGGIDVAAFSDSGRWLASARARSLVVQDLQTGKSFRPAVDFDFRITSLALHPAEPIVLIGAADGAVYRWDLQPRPGLPANRAIERYRLHTSVVSGVQFHPLGRMFFSADWSGNLVAWLNYGADVHEGRYDKHLLSGRYYTGKAEHVSIARGGAAEELGAILVSADGQRIITSTNSGSLELFQVRGNAQLGVIKVGRGPVVGLTYWPSGDRVAAALRDGTIRVYTLKVMPAVGIGTVPEVEFVQDQEYQVPQARGLVVLGTGQLVAVTAQGRPVLVGES